ncbi:hypothetical protein [Domibacillus tundrae]|uniref:hypothetical protein n=1 Tax=Domibacillus tundrae TaxID=1587527 RepID=UPI000617AC67|nr:hypothetical protein [Domibacillus tundrae]
MNSLSHDDKVMQAIEAARKREKPLPFEMDIPSFIRQQSKSNDEYIRWVRGYFKSSHPHLTLVRIEKKLGVLVKKER